MKVVYCIPQSKIGGAEVVFSSLENHILSDIEIIKVDLGLKKNNPLLYLKAIITLSKLFRSQSINLVITSLWKSHLIVIISSFFCDIKLIPFLHSTNWFNRYDEFISKIILKKSFAVIVDSESVKNARAIYIPHKRIFKVSMRTINNVNRKIYKNIESEIKFVFLGRITKSKRLDKSMIFLDKLKTMHKHLDISFNVYGPVESSYSNEWQNLITSYPDVKINTHPSINNKDVSDKLQAHDFYLQLSDIEGMSMSVMESMIVGLIPIVTRVGEISTYAIDNKNAILCNKEDSIDKIVNKFSILFHDTIQLERLSKEAYKTFEVLPLFRDDLFSVIKKITKCVE